MDPITAISLASNVISFIDFGTKVLSGARKVQEAGALEDNETLESVVRQMQTFIAKLLAPDQINLTGTDLGLAELAARCRDVADDLLRLLEKIKAKDPASKRQAVWSVIKNLKYDEEKKGLEARLASCRSQLEIQLNFLASQENRARLQNILQGSENNSRRLEEIWSSITHLRNAVDAAGFGDVARGQMQQLCRIPEAMVDVVAQERIVNGIRSHGMKTLNERHDTICEAHSRTFEWLVSKTEENNAPAEASQSDFNIFQSTAFQAAFSHMGSSPLLVIEGDGLSADEEDILAEFDDWRQHLGVLLESPRNKPIGDSELSNDLQARRFARTLFLEWLSSGEGVFHFSGKLGAGKSTLMKLMCSHEHVKQLVEAWASMQNRKLVFAKHFFYKLGTGHQKSLAGMYRTLLHEILESCPELTRSALPNLWAKARETPWQVGKEIYVSDRDVRKAFDYIVGSSATDNNFRFCFFVDGLDELENDTAYSHGDLVNLFHDWHRRSSGNVKLVVSSREHNVFMDRFSPSQRICLHALTRRDLERFTQDKLSGIQSSETRSQIVDKIVDKAQGIFFWVALVVDSVRRRLEDGFDLELDDMVEQIDDIPPEINGLFAYILDSLDNWTRRKAYRTLSMMLEATRWDLQVPVYGYIFLDEYEKTPRPDFGLTHAIKYRSGNYRISHQWTEKRLKAICKGLVECSTPFWLSTKAIAEPFLQFGHRSVEEFLSHPERKREMISYLGNFSAPEALTHMILLSKRSSGDFDDAYFWRSQGFYDLPHILMMRQKHALDKEPWKFLESFETWVDKSDGLMLLENYDQITAWPILLLIPSLAKHDNSLIATPLFVLTLLGFEEYPVWKVRKAPRGYFSPAKVSLVISCAFEHYYLPEWYRLPRPKPGSSSVGPALVRVLLECGLASWDMKMEWGISIFQTSKATLGSPMNLLQQSFLVASIEATKHGTDWIGIILEYLLSHKPYLDFCITERPSGEYLNFTSKGEVAFWFLCKQALTIDPAADCGPKQIVEASSFSNRGRILEMLEDQMGQAKPKVLGASSSVDPKHSQSQESRSMAVEASQLSERDRSPNAEQPRILTFLEKMTPNDRIDKALFWKSAPAKFGIAFVIGTMFGFAAKHMIQRWWQL